MAMDTATAPATSIGTEENDEERNPRRYRSVFLLVLGLSVGLVLGAVLTIISVLLPRQAELARVRDTSPFMNSLTTDQVLKNDPKRPWLTRTEDQAMTNSGRKVYIWGRTYYGTIIAPQHEHGLIFDQINGSLQSQLLANGLPSWNTTTSTSSDGVRVIHSQTLQYQGDGYQGSVQLIRIGDGDRMTLIVSIHER